MGKQRSRLFLLFTAPFLINQLFLKPVQGATIARGSSSNNNGSSCKPKCPIPLTLDLHCGSNGITYVNLEELECAKQNCFPDLRAVKRGRCQTGENSVDARESKKIDNGITSVKSCELKCSCPETVEKICGSDGETYLNQCYLNCRKTCSNLPTLQKHHSGPCGRLFFPDDPEYVDYVDASFPDDMIESSSEAPTVNEIA